MKQQLQYSFGQVISIEIAKIADHKNLYNSKALVLVIIHFISVMSFAKKANINQGFLYFMEFLSVFTFPPDLLLIPISIIILLLFTLIYGSLLWMSYMHFNSQGKVSLQKMQFKQLRILTSIMIEIAVQLSCPILSINLAVFSKQNNGWKTIPVLNLFLLTLIVLSYYYFYRNYQFNQHGLYRTFNPISYMHYLVIFVIVALEWSSINDIQTYILLVLSVIYLIDIVWFYPYKVAFENKVYLFGCSGLFILSLLCSLSQITSYINQNNIFETFLIGFPVFFWFSNLIQQNQWINLVQYMKNSNSIKSQEIRKLCSQMEALTFYIEEARNDTYKLFLSVYLLEHHTKNCTDTSCECKEDLSKQQTNNNESMTHRSSFQSKTALLSNNDKNSQQNASQALEISQLQKTIREPSKRNDSISGNIFIDNFFKSNSKQQQYYPLRFIKNNVINEELISQYIKRQFHQTIQQLSFSIQLDDVEYLCLKYISFMFSFKQNSSSSLTKLRQIQSRTVQFSYFFRNTTKVTEASFIEALKHKHQEEKNTFDDLLKMNVTEIWRLEMVRDDVVKNIVAVLRKKIRLWEELCSGDISTMNRFIEEIIKISEQIEISRNQVDNILSDFNTEVQKNYSYYLKYQCFSYLFFDSDYKKAINFQRKVEDSWQLSKVAHKQGQIGNFQWLSGDLVTLEVSVGVQSGYIIKGISQRLVELLGYANYEDMIQNLRIRGLQASHGSSQHSDKIQISSIMPPYLTASHNYFIQRFIHRGYTLYYDKPISSFACDYLGFVFPVNISLSFNFANMNDFSLLGSILRIKDEDEYLIFDEWGRILGVSMKTFDKLILKGALEEFGLVQFKMIDHKLDKMNNLRQTLMHKIARDENAKLFKKTLTMHQKQSTTRSSAKRTYQKPSDILLQFGSIQHFLPQIGKAITDLLAKDIFKKLQRESQEQFNKLTEQKDQKQNDKFEKQASNIFQRQISQFMDRQQSIGNQGLSSAMLDKDQYRNFILNNFIDDQGLMKINQSLLQDEKLVMYVPKNYNELIEYFNDAGERFMETKQDMESKSIRRQQMQNKYSYIKQQQNCYHLFDAEFQDFIDNKVRKYYSKALLKEAIENQESKLLTQVRYKCVSTVDVGVGGVSEKDQFLYFVCKLQSLNLQTAKRRDVLKIHMKKEKNQQFEGSEELRRSLIQQASSLDSIDKEKPKWGKSLSIQQQDSFGGPQVSIKYKGDPIVQEQPIVVTLAVPQTRSYVAITDRDEGPNMKANFEATNQKLNESSFEIESSMKESLLPGSSSNNVSMTQSLNLNVPNLMRQNSMEKMKQMAEANSKVTTKEFQKEKSVSLKDEEPKDPPKKVLKLSFLKKMEKALVHKDQPDNQDKPILQAGIDKPISQVGIDKPILPSISVTPDKSPSNLSLVEKQPSQLAPEERKSSLTPSFGLFAKLFARLNLRRVSNVEIKHDQFEQNDQGFKEQSENNSEKEDMKKSGHSTPSGSNSMSSNNITSNEKDLQEEEDDPRQDDELVNIFEVMSQASNHQSIKSISAISMATNISLRCLSYVPRQAKSLQLFKIILIALNISGIISLLLTTQSYFDNLNIDQLSLKVNNQYRYSAITLQSSNQIDQEQIISFDNKPNDTLMLNIVDDVYSISFDISQSYFDVMEQLLDAVSFPLPTPELLSIPSDYSITSLQEFLTQQKIEIDSIQYITTYNRSLNDSSYSQLYNTSLDYLMNRFVFSQAQINSMSTQLRDYNNNNILNKALIVTYLMACFGGLHLIVILLIVPFIRQINQIYFRVLSILSRVNGEEAEDEIKKLTLSQHLLEAQDDSWVTQNQVKLVFYNKSKDIDLNEKYVKNGKSKGKESQYFSSKLIDTQISIWKDMALYITISSISIGYLIFSIIIIQTQINTFTPFIDNFDETVSVSVFSTTLICKLAITPERYLNINTSSIPTQYTIFNYQQNGQISYFLQTISSDSSKVKSYINDMSNFLEELNLNYDFDANNTKITITQSLYDSRLSYLKQLSILSEINHLLKDNLCYYQLESICSQQAQFDYFNTGLMGALDTLQKMQFNYENFLSDYHAIIYSNNSENYNIVNSYYNSQDFEFMILYGQQLIYKSFDRLIQLLQNFLQNEKNSRQEMISNLFIGIGIPIMILTILLAALEMYLLRRKVRRVMLSLTYLPTFKFQEKTILSLIKAILKI